MKQTITFPIGLGDTVRDRVTGFTGVVTGLTIWFNKCQRAVVQPPVDKEGASRASDAFDVEQLDVLDVAPIAMKESRAGMPDPGGPMPSVTRASMPERR